MESNGNELICIDENSGLDKSNFLFQKTKGYVLNTTQCITVPAGYTAEVYIKLAGQRTVTPCTGKKLVRAIKRGKELLDKDFYVIFSNHSKKLPKKTWGVGKLLVKSQSFSYQVGANGTFDIEIVDQARYINSFGERSVGVFTVDRVTEHVINCIREHASDIIIKLFEEVGTLVVNTEFLLDELNLRFEEFFTYGELDELPGIRITNINAVSLLVREEDIQNARKQLAAMKAPVRRPRAPRTGSGAIRRPVTRRAATTAAESGAGATTAQENAHPKQ